MKKYLTITALYILFLLLYSAVFIFLGLTVSTNFFIGSIFVSCAYVISLITLLFSDRSDSPSFPSNISLCFVSIFYLIITIYINYKYGLAIIIDDKLFDLTPTGVFVLYHFVCAIIYIAIYISIMVLNIHVRNSKNSSDEEREAINNIVNTVVSLKQKLNQLPNNADIVKKIDKLSDDIKFMNINNNMEKYEKIEVLIDRLSNDISNCVEIETTDYSSIDVTISKIYEVMIKD